MFDRSKKLPPKVVVRPISIFCPAIAGNVIPQKYTCDGKNVSPPLIIKDEPARTKSMVLIIDDPDTPSGNFTHWLIYNINPKIRTFEENKVPVGVEFGMNDAGKYEYVGPCPPRLDGASPLSIHQYHFRIYALDTRLNLPHGADRGQLEKAMVGHIIAEGEQVYEYGRKQKSKVV
jgi:hypothetical protein